MRAHQAHYPITTLCRVLGVSTSGYYAWLKRPLPARVRKDGQLTNRIRKIHTRSKGTYGAPRIHAELAEAGVQVGCKRVAQLMRAAALQGVSRRKGPRTTRRQPGAEPAPDLVQRDISVSGSNRLWVADITFVGTSTGWLHLAAWWMPGAGGWSAGRWPPICAPSWCCRR